ncbi:MAG: 16S rRNA (cytosine(1402)-N(4))-methyltransferase [Candidatus Terrybacteria bacterium CG10_big_fil_rev_8_21_14_0_10_41_10]|uniref:Ribosomal RNA small subunit methyltransferase H n=1 Tax=Candidatus Terrybacteria bacterium CG10_big_fil_rev_8_21_14_0_10_41_10 TaxID=1975026 RepID=A0A2M8LAZ3_9BACT|nr:MAG: 16S rRNA (cytosine(1402)-N(4))-methyltransferase [Candidatus Terrybacteria bacterium CG10_big_fil_rev_8_21_14_0_10_41_10]
MPHVPVLLNEAISHLEPKTKDVIVDATVGAGGHLKGLYDSIKGKGVFIGLDQDEESLEILRKSFNDSRNVFLINENFRNLDKILRNLKIEKVDRIIFDLGVSSMQIDDYGRGISFKKNEPLIMSMRKDAEAEWLTAMDVVNSQSESDIADLIYKYGEERFSRKIAKGIVESRRKKKIETTFDLVEIIERSVPVFYRRGRIHCATRTFQALRIAVNDELGALEEVLPKAWSLLGKSGRIAVISFHSLEDRIVKNFFRGKAKEGEAKLINKKPITPTQEEIKANPRSRSAKMRVIEKII